MPILLVFALTAACLPVKWEPPLVGDGLESAGRLTAAAVGLSLAAALVLRTWVVRTLYRFPARKGDVARTYSRLRRLFFFLNLGLVALCVLVFGWGWAVREVLGVARDWDGAPPFAELAVPLPYFLVLFGAWVVYYDADRALHRTTVAGPTERAFWSRAGYFLNHLRQFSLVMLPVFLFAAQQSVTRLAPETAKSVWYPLIPLATVPLLVLLMPLLIKPMLGLVPMPPGPTRDRLTALAKRLHFRCTDFLLWPTHGAAANAMIVGLLPRVRYVIFTDRILEELPPDEVDAVFGHEVGHARHGHIPLYALFLVLSLMVLAGLLLFTGRALEAAGEHPPPWAENWLVLTPVVVVAVYVFVVFGYLSRRCERQADVFGCRAVSCADPACTGHDAATVYPERGRGLCPTGIRTFIRALDRVEDVNGGVQLRSPRRGVGTMLKGFFGWLRAWQHSTMPRRMAYLQSLIGNPARERRFQRGMVVLRWGLILVLCAALVALGEAIGWREFWDEL